MHAKLVSRPDWLTCKPRRLPRTSRLRSHFFSQLPEFELAPGELFEAHQARREQEGGETFGGQNPYRGEGGHRRSERRQVDGDSVQAEEEIFAKRFFGDRLNQVRVRRSDDAHTYSDRNEELQTRGRGRSSLSISASVPCHTCATEPGLEILRLATLFAPYGLAASKASAGGRAGCAPLS